MSATAAARVPFVPVFRDGKTTARRATTAAAVEKPSAKPASSGPSYPPTPWPLRSPLPPTDDAPSLFDVELDSDDDDDDDAKFALPSPALPFSPAPAPAPALAPTRRGVLRRFRDPLRRFFCFGSSPPRARARAPAPDGDCEGEVQLHLAAGPPAPGFVRLSGYCVGLWPEKERKLTPPSVVPPSEDNAPPAPVFPAVFLPSESDDGYEEDMWDAVSSGEIWAEVPPASSASAAREIRESLEQRAWHAEMWRHSYMRIVQPLLAADVGNGSRKPSSWWDEVEPAAHGGRGGSQPRSVREI